MTGLLGISLMTAKLRGHNFSHHTLKALPVFIALTMVGGQPPAPPGTPAAPCVPKGGTPGGITGGPPAPPAGGGLVVLGGILPAGVDCSILESALFLSSTAVSGSTSGTSILCLA